MRIQFSPTTARRASGFGVPLTIILLLVAAMARAQTPYAATGWVDQVVAPPIVCTNALGQVLLRATVFTVRLDCPDPRLTGRRTVLSDGYLQADGSTVMYGTGFHEVGTWAGTNFSPTGGMWELKFRGVMQTNYSLQHRAAGYGLGGNIEGLRLEETTIRTNASSLFDPTLPLLIPGTIKAPPLNTVAVLDNFDDNVLTDWSSAGSGQFFNTNQQLTVRGYYPGVRTTSIHSSFLLGYHPASVTIPDGQTREWRADVVRIEENATNHAALVIGTPNGVYAVQKGRDYLFIDEFIYSVNRFCIFACERAAIRNTNVVLALALTRKQADLVITARVLDKANPNMVLYQRTVVDTPAADPTLSAAQFQAVTGMNLLDLGADAGAAPLSSSGAGVAVFQYTDGSAPAVLATFDNLEMRTSELPFVGIERAVRLSWPTLSTLNYAIEGAPSAQGPWLPVQDTTIPGMNQITVPANHLMQFFRAVQAP